LFKIQIAGKVTKIDYLAIDYQYYNKLLFKIQIAGKVTKIDYLA
jgi:hypothetical protein